jgi:curli biogenesis system outer membrane secretion channel CsgG
MQSHLEHRKEAGMLRSRFVRTLTSYVALAGALAALAVPAAQAQTKPRIAVMNFANNSTWAFWGEHLGRAAADELVTQLLKGGNFTVIERAQLETVLDEQRLGASGAVNAATAAKIGKVLGVQFIVTGSITQFSIQTTRAGIGAIGGSYSNAESKLDVRLINAETAEIVVAAEGQGNKRMGGGFFRNVGAERTFDAGVAQEALRPAIEQVAVKIAGQGGKLGGAEPAAPTGQIVGVKSGQYYINRGENAGVKVGQQFAVNRVTDEIKDADGRVLDRIVSKVGTLEVVQVLSQSSVCKLIDGQARVNDTIQ